MTFFGDHLTAKLEVQGNLKASFGGSVEQFPICHSERKTGFYIGIVQKSSMYSMYFGLKSMLRIRIPVSLYPKFFGQIRI
jgi:hypothetical protein